MGLPEGVALPLMINDVQAKMLDSENRNIVNKSNFLMILSCFQVHSKVRLPEVVL